MTASVSDIGHRRGPLPVWTFADRIRKVRRDMKLTQGKFAALLGVGEKRYAAWESGINGPDDPRAICEKLEEVTGIPREWFMGWAEGPLGPADALRPRSDSNRRPIA